MIATWLLDVKIATGIYLSIASYYFCIYMVYSHVKVN